MPWSFFFFLLPFSCFGCRWSGRELMMRADRLASYPTPCTLTDKHTRELSSQRAAFSFFFLLFLLPFFIDDGLYTDTRLPHSISPHCSQQTRLWRWQRWPRGCTEGDFFSLYRRTGSFWSKGVMRIMLRHVVRDTHTERGVGGEKTAWNLWFLVNRADNHTRFNRRDANDVSLLNYVDYRELRREKGGVVVEPKRGGMEADESFDDSWITRVLNVPVKEKRGRRLIDDVAVLRG